MSTGEYKTYRIDELRYTKWRDQLFDATKEEMKARWIMMLAK
jgi:hypothetical protein